VPRFVTSFIACWCLVSRWLGCWDSGWSSISTCLIHISCCRCSARYGVCIERVCYRSSSSVVNHNLSSALIHLAAHCLYLRGRDRCLAHVGSCSYHATINFAHRICRSSCISFLDRGFGILGWFGRLSDKLFDRIFILVLGFESHSTLFAFEAFNLNFFINIVSTLTSCAWNGSNLGSRIFLPGELFLRTPILNIDRQALRRQETEPLECLRVKTNLSKGIVPVRQT